jgi:hypothetical protein
MESSQSRLPNCRRPVAAALAQCAIPDCANPVLTTLHHRMASGDFHREIQSMMGAIQVEQSVKYVLEHDPCPASLHRGEERALFSRVPGDMGGRRGLG